MSENAPEIVPALDDHFGLEINDQYVGRALTNEEVEELLND